jgi:DNA-binding PadR family transcriptional regulator
MSTALTPTSYLVLGCLSAAGPATSYDIKQLVTAGIGYFWSFPHAQLYSEPIRLLGAGLVSEEQEDGGRRRRVFTITPAGTDALQTWLAEPTVELPEIRDIALLKVFFGADARDHTAMSRLASAQLRAHRERLDLYEAMDNDSTPEHPRSTLRFGIAYELSVMAFWEEMQKSHKH